MLVTVFFESVAMFICIWLTFFMYLNHVLWFWMDVISFGYVHLFLVYFLHIFESCSLVSDGWLFILFCFFLLCSFYAVVELPSSKLETMRCLPFFDESRKGESKTIKVVSNLSSSSALGDDEVNRSCSDLNSQCVSDTSTDSIRKNSFLSMSQRSTSNLRVFAFQELKTATKGFSRSVRIGEGGFGCVYKGMIKSLEDPSVKVDVAVKQLGKRGLQASNFNIRFSC